MSRARQPIVYSRRFTSAHHAAVAEYGVYTTTRDHMPAKTAKGSVGGKGAHKPRRYENTKYTRTNPAIEKRNQRVKKQLSKGAGATRGTVVNVAVPTTYTKPSNNVIIELCKRVTDPDDPLTTQLMWSMHNGTKGEEKGSFEKKFGISANTLYTYLKNDRWRTLTASDEVDRPSSGQPPLLGVHIEDVMMRVLCIAHRSGVPYKDKEIMSYAAKIATKLKLVNHVTQLPYTTDADMTSWFRVRH